MHKEMACRNVDQMRDRLVSVSRRIYEHPELKLEETYASGLLADELRSAGFSVETGVAGLETAIRAEHPRANPGPTVAILGEYDALPGMGHACGHNLIAAAALGAVIAIGSMKHDLPGKLVFLGCPGEEGAGGKVIMLDAGLFDGVDAAMMFHPASYTVVERGSVALTQVEIEFTGRAADASSAADKGINALDAVIQTFNGINAMRQHVKDRARIQGIITEGGLQPNIIPDHTAALFYLRSPETGYMAELVEKLHCCAKGAGLATGAKVSLKIVGYPYMAMRDNHALGEAFTRNLVALGEPLVPMPPNAGMGSTDMGNVSWQVPSIHAYIQICNEQTAGHSREFAQAAISRRGLDAMLTAAKALATTAIDMLIDPSLVVRMREEFGKPA
jgi:amidohydrolase